MRMRCSFLAVGIVLAAPSICAAAGGAHRPAPRGYIHSEPPPTTEPAYTRDSSPIDVQNALNDDIIKQNEELQKIIEQCLANRATLDKSTGVCNQNPTK